MPTLSKSKTSRRKSPQQGRAKATVEAILQAASQVLVAEGYARMTTTRVAERAGVSVGSLYQYFDDKEQLMRALKERLSQTMLHATASATADSGGMSLSEQVRAMLAALLAAKASEGGLGPALTAAMLQIDGQLASAEVLEASKLQVRALLARHRDEHDLKDLTGAASTLVHAVDGVVLGWVLHPRKTRPLTDPRNVDELHRLVMGYLGAAEQVL